LICIDQCKTSFTGPSRSKRVGI